jgi:hypothetical protein
MLVVTTVNDLVQLVSNIVIQIFDDVNSSANNKKMPETLSPINIRLQEHGLKYIHSAKERDLTKQPNTETFQTILRQTALPLPMLTPLMPNHRRVPNKRRIINERAQITKNPQTPINPRLRPTNLTINRFSNSIRREGCV